MTFSCEVKWKSPKPLHGIFWQPSLKRRKGINSSGKLTVLWRYWLPLPPLVAYPPDWLQLTHMEVSRTHRCGPDFPSQLQPYSSIWLLAPMPQLGTSTIMKLPYYLPLCKPVILPSLLLLFILSSQGKKYEVIFHFSFFHNSTDGHSHSSVSFITSLIYTSFFFSIAHSNSNSSYLTFEILQEALRPLTSISTC